VDPIAAENRDAWNRQVEKRNPWTVPVGPEVIAAAREGRWHVVLTPERPVPREWFGALAGCDLLALASGGGQQACVLAAAGANVTLLDVSPAQLGRDREVAARDGLQLRIEEGDMRDLSRFPDDSFDVVFHPVSNLFVPDVRPVWRECRRVLRAGGRLLAGFGQPFLFLFDDEEMRRGELIARYTVPYADRYALPPERLARMREQGEPMVFGHTLEDQIGGQLDAGLRIEALYEDGWPGEAIGRLIKPFLATLARRP
jgi:SAM-dependent methyltransferase